MTLLKLICQRTLNELKRISEQVEDAGKGVLRSYYKIMHTTCHTGWGGLEKRIFNESVWMRDHGHKIVLAVPENTELHLRAKEAGFKVYPVNFKRLSTLKDYRSIRRILYNEKPDIINTHGNKDSKLALYAAKKEKIACRILSRHISAHVRNSWYNRKLYRKLAHYVFTTAGYTTAHLKKVFRLKEMQVFSMPSGIIIPKALPDKETCRKELAEKLSLDPVARFIGFAGRVSKDKGVDILVKAFALVASQYPDMHLVIAGKGNDDYLRQIKQTARKKQIDDRVHFTGFYNDVWPFYRALDLKVLPSRNPKGVPFEGVPQSLLEAMAAQVPVIGSDSGGITDIIRHNETGLLFKTSDENDLSRKIQQVFSKPEKTAERVQNALEIVRKKHTIDAMGRDILRIYRLHQVRIDQEKKSRVRF